MSALNSITHISGKVFRNNVGEPYLDTGRTSGGQFKNGWSRACERSGFPGRYRVWVLKGEIWEKRTFVPEITPHALRHTWASWHYCLHRDLLHLKQDGGWSGIKMVERYSKLVPAAYEAEIREFLSGSIRS